MLTLYIRLSIKNNACSNVMQVHAPIKPYTCPIVPIEIFKTSVHSKKDKTYPI